MSGSAIHRKGLRIGCFLLLLLVGVLQLRLALFAQSEFSRREDRSALHKYQRNPYLLTWLAKQKHLLAADLEAALALYQQALTVNPVYLPAWFGLAELSSDRHQKQTADAILDYTDSLAENLKRWRWDKAMIAYQLDRKDILARDLSYIIQKIPGKSRNDALRLAFSVWPDAAELVEQLGHENLDYLFRYASTKKNVETGWALWRMLESEGIEGREEDLLTFINMLLLQKEVSAASAIWKKYFNPNRLFYNGNFSQEPLQTAFAWRIGKNEGVSWRILEGEKEGESAVLHLHFNRKSNVRLSNIYQVIPLEGGKVYILKGKMKTAKLTTDQLPFLEVHGYQCTSPLGRMEMVKSDQSWTTVFLQFKVSQGCEAVVVRLRRHESSRIDNKLAGDFWLTDLEIAETGKLFTILDE